MPDVNVGTAYGRLKLIDDFTGGLRKANAAMDASAKRAEADFGRIRDLSRSAALGMMGIGAAGIAAAGGMVKAAAAFEQTEVAFGTLLKSGKAATAMLQDLQKFANATPFQFTELTVATRRMMALGFAAKDVIPNLRILGDAAAGLSLGSEGLNRIILALGQMKAKGKVSGEEMRQLAEAGIPAWGYLAEAIGKTTGEVMKLSEKGVIPADKAIQAILGGMSGQFGGMMAKQAETAAGKFSTLKDAVEELSRELGKGLLPIAKDATAKLSEMVDWVGKLTDEQKRSYAQWGFYGAVTVGAAGVLTRMTIALPGIIEGLKAIRALLLTPLGVRGALVAGGIVAGGLIVRNAIKQAEADVAARQAGPATIMDPRTGQPMKAPPRFQFRAGKLPPGLVPPGLAAISAAALPEATAAWWEAKRRKGERSHIDLGAAPAKAGERQRASKSTEDVRREATERTLRGLENALASARARGNSRSIAAARDALLGALSRVVSRYGPATDIGSQARQRWAELNAERARGAISSWAGAYQRDVSGREEPAAGATFGGAVAWSWQARQERLEEEQAARREQVANWWDLAGFAASERLQRASNAVGAGMTGVLAAGRGLQSGLTGLANAADMGRQLSGMSGAMTAAGKAIGKAIAEGVADQARNAEERWERSWGRVGQEAFWASRERGGMGVFARDFCTSGLAGMWQNTMKRVAGPETRIGRWLGKNQQSIGDVAGTVQGLYDISKGSGGFAGGAMAGASIGGMFGPLGAGVGAIVGALAGWANGAAADRRRQHEEAQRARAYIGEQIARLAHDLTPVSDYFRSAGMNNLPGLATFGGAGLAAEAARGARW